MKKKLRYKSGRRPRLIPSKLLFMMKLSALLLTIACMQVSASAISQKMSLSVKNAPLEQVLKIIKKRSGYQFIYNNELLENAKPVTVNISDGSIRQVLEQCFENQPLSFELLEKTIVVKPKVPETSTGEQAIEPEALVVRGKVTDERGGALPGVSILIKGTQQGMLTDASGNFSIEVPDENAVLVFSFVGFITQEVPVANKSVLNVSMKVDEKALEEVVVVGYGTRAKSDLTGAISQITAEEITKQNTLSPQLAMQGKMAGVFVSNPGSDPTARPSIRIRGVSTLGFNDPLYVIDGIPLTEGGAASSSSREQDLRGPVNVFSLINPNDIESISVLKDASASAIYGVRASNGVVLITTKRGSSGRATVNVSANYGVQNNSKRYKMASVQEYVDWSMEAKNANPAFNPDQYFSLYDASSPNYLGNSQDYTDEWVNSAILKNAKVQDFNVSISGGNKVSTYAAGVGSSMQENVFNSNKFTRHSLFFNSDHQLTKWLKVGESYRFIYTKTDSHPGGELTTAFGAPWQPLYDADNLYGFASPGRSIDDKFYSYGYGTATRSNFLGLAELEINNRSMLRNLGTVYAEVTLLPGLKLKTNFSFDYYNNNRDSYSDVDRGIFEVVRAMPYPATTGNTYGRRLNDNINLVKELSATYSNSFGKHSFDVILNGMDQKVQWNLTQMTVSNQSPITDFDQRRIEEGWDNNSKSVFYERNRSGLQGYMGRLSYNFDRKIYLDATVRRDGTSKFGPGYKWGTFPSFAAAWRISSEKFMDFKWMNDLKIRAGWGKLGNQETRDYAFLSQVNMNPKAAFGTGANGNGTIYAASTLGDFPIEDMSWETVTTSNIGFDALFFNSKLAVTLEYYNRLTDGILQTISIPKVIGVLSSPVVNLAQVTNKGIEFQVGYSDVAGPVSYNVSSNFTTVNNSVKKLYGGQPVTNGNTRIEEGYSMNYLYGYKTQGLFQTTQQVAEHLATVTDAGYDAQKSPGDVIFSDLNGAPLETDPEGSYISYSPDGKIDGYDRTYLGKSIPGYYYGINAGLKFKNWDTNLSFRGTGDVQKVNTLGKQTISGFGSHFQSAYRDRWTPANTSSTIPRAAQSDPSGNNRIADRHIEDAGFLRFQNFQIGYSFQSSFLESKGMKQLRCYLYGNNVFVISGYNDLDPEDITTPTTFGFGVNLSF
ncbi:TonB-dependent receptor [Persicitalea jodogahamensis]|nr:TonB-dependent receptor [Persicitalea jodogahamensis]